MKYSDEYQDKKLAYGLLEKIYEINFSKKIKLMEVCGTHTMSIYKYGIKNLIPDTIELISGPGCPVCVTPEFYINKAVSLAKNKNIIITTFGDLLRVPANNSSLLQEMTEGKNIKIVYSPLEAVDIAVDNPDKEVIFLAIGFETTIPTIALSVKKAEKLKIENFSILQSLKIMPPILKQLLYNGDINIDGFILPGHVSTILGFKAFSFLSRNHNIPGVVAGFEPLDIIISIYHLSNMLKNNKADILNLYKRLVKPQGNQKALEIINDMFLPVESCWRGIGMIEESGLKLKDKYIKFSAENKFHIEQQDYKKNEECLCGEIIIGKREPFDCKLFSKGCTPLKPMGPCMVSREGTCSVYYHYRDKERLEY